jgi:hypothetical protein
VVVEDRVFGAVVVVLEVVEVVVLDVVVEVVEVLVLEVVDELDEVVVLLLGDEVVVEVVLVFGEVVELLEVVEELLGGVVVEDGAGLVRAGGVVVVGGFCGTLMGLLGCPGLAVPRTSTVTKAAAAPLVTSRVPVRSRLAKTARRSRRSSLLRRRSSSGLSEARWLSAAMTGADQ